jgi:hypothetical protein
MRLRLLVSMLMVVLAASLAGCGASKAHTSPILTTPTPSSTASTTSSSTPSPACSIPQNNGGDHDADNNGGPDDGDGCDN